MTVTLTREGPVAWITLERPEKLNALDLEGLRLLEEAVAAVEASEEVRAAIVTGAGERAFCAGADVGAWSGLEPLDMWRRWNREGHRVLDRLAGLRQPTVALLNGVALGGGLEVALACDLVVAVEGVELGLPEVRLGTVPGWGGTQRLARLVGPARAKRLILTGERIDAATAERWGLVCAVVPRTSAREEALRLAHAVAAGAPVAVQAAKQLVDGAHDPATALETLAGGLTRQTRDGEEGVVAFRDRRPPEFTGA